MLASCVLDTPADLMLTAPEVTEKSAVANEAIPLLEVVASSPAIVNSFAETDTSIPSPSVICRVSPKFTASVVPAAPSLMVNEGLASIALVIVSSEIVLLACNLAFLPITTVPSFEITPATSASPLTSKFVVILTFPETARLLPTLRSTPVVILLAYTWCHLLEVEPSDCLEPVLGVNPESIKAVTVKVSAEVSPRVVLPDTSNVVNNAEATENAELAGKEKSPPIVKFPSITVLP